MSLTITTTFGSAEATAYISIAEASNLLEASFDFSVWDGATAEDKARSILQATRAIDLMSFIGAKLTDTQSLEFGRLYDDGTSDTEYPEPVKLACALEALWLLKYKDDKQSERALKARRDGILSRSTEGASENYNDPSKKSALNCVEAERIIYPFLRSVSVETIRTYELA